MSQPAKGFRAGTDSVLLGASVAPASTSLLDLGAGAGVAGLVALAHNPGLSALLAEADPEMHALARANIESNGFDGRAGTSLVDVTATGKQRLEAGLAANAFSTVIANPPYFDADSGTRSSLAPRAGGRHMAAAALDAWVKTAAACAAGWGEAIFIYRADGLRELLDAFAARFGNIDVLPVAPRPREPAALILVRGIKGSRAPLTLLSPLVLHGETGRGYAPEVEAVLRGKSILHWRGNGGVPK
ncbi:MAG TPA: methyltransferase [Devosiaceae bacterium]